MTTWGEVTARVDLGTEIVPHDRISYTLDGDGTACARCGVAVGWSIIDGDYGRPEATWTECFVGVDGPVCEWCDIEATPSAGCGVPVWAEPDMAYTPDEVVEIERPPSWWQYADDGGAFVEWEEENGLHFDETVCAMGAQCCSIRPAPLGFHLGPDDEGRWAYPFRLPDGRLVCEDCSQEWEESYR